MSSTQGVTSCVKGDRRGETDDVGRESESLCRGQGSPGPYHVEGS